MNIAKTEKTIYNIEESAENGRKRQKMKISRKIAAFILALIMIIPLCSTAFAAEKTLYTESFLNELCRTKKLCATVTSHTYDGKTDKTDFVFYDDLNTGKICADFKPQGIKAVYSDGNADCFFTKFFFYVSVPAKNIPLISTAFEQVDDFQSLLNKFIDNFDMNDFNATVTTETKNGEVFTYEKLEGKVVTVSATFGYNSEGELCEIWFTDTLGESVSFGLEDVSVDFDNSIFNPPTICFDLSFLWNLIKLFISE